MASREAMQKRSILKQVALSESSLGEPVVKTQSRL